MVAIDINDGGTSVDDLRRKRSPGGVAVVLSAAVQCVAALELLDVLADRVALRAVPDAGRLPPPGAIVAEVEHWLATKPQTPSV